MNRSPAVILTRREALKAAAVAAVALPLFRSSLSSAELGHDAGAATPEALPVEKTPVDDREHGLRLGIASYSTRMLTLDETIAVLGILRVKNTGLFKAHCDWQTATVDQCRA